MCAARSTCRARASWSLPTPKSSPTSCSSCAATSAPFATPCPPERPDAQENHRDLGALAAARRRDPVVASDLLGLRRVRIHLPQPLAHLDAVHRIQGTDCR